MRVLYFSPRECWPITAGAHLRDYYLARALSECGDLRYLGFVNSAGSVRRGAQGPGCELESVLVPRDGAYSPWRIARGLVGPFPVNVLNFTSPLMSEELTKLLAECDFDLVQMEGVHLISYVPLIRAARSRPRLVCDWHNVESELMRRYSENSAIGAPRRLYAARAAQLLERLEDRLLQECDAHLVCSERERELLQRRAPSAKIEVVPNGVDYAFQSAGDRSTEVASRRDLVFVGSMDYHANVDAVVHFAGEIWPRLHAAIPALRFVIVGARPVAEVVALQAQHENIVVTGMVPDVRPYYSSAVAAVAPLRVGSGTRLKIVEAMAAGVPVISSRLGIEGLHVTPGGDVLVADDADEFMSAVSALTGDERMRSRIARAGQETARTRYDWPTIGEKLCAFYADLTQTVAP